MAGFKGFKFLVALCLSLAVAASISSASASDSSGGTQPAAASGSARGGGDPLPACTIKAVAPVIIVSNASAIVEATIFCNQRLLPEHFRFKVCLQYKVNGVFKNSACGGFADVRVDNSPWLIDHEAFALREGSFIYRTRAKATRLATGVSEAAVSGTVVVIN